MRRLLLLCALFVCSFSAFAAKGPGAVRKQIESSLLVDGTIDITATGEVVAHTLDKPEQLPKGILEMAARTLPQGKFEPVALQGKTVSRSKMTLLFIARKLDDGRYAIDLRSASFYSMNPQDHISVAPTGNPRLTYPMPLMRVGVSGTIYLQMKIDRDGKVANIDASHVDLRVVGSEADMKRWRSIMARSSIETVRKWRFVVPESGPDANTDFWFGTLPVNYLFEAEKPAEYGRWQTYVAGPKALIPWLQDTRLSGENIDALAPNRFHTAGSDRRLLTPLTGD